MSKYEKLKIGIISFFVLGMLFCFNKYSENGRYVFSNKTEYTPLIIDSRTGEIYSISTKQKLSLDQYKKIKIKK